MNTLGCVTAKSNHSKGYVSLTFEGKQVLVHRLAYCQHHSVTLESIEGQVVRHSCDVRNCFNPEHLSLGTSADNTQDMVDRNRDCAGDKHIFSMLTNEEAASIRARYKFRCPINGGRALAAEFGVAPSTISEIVNMKRYTR